MIYRKRAYTPAPLRRVCGVVHEVTLKAPDGMVFQISWAVRDDEAKVMNYPRAYMAERLRCMRRALRERVAQHNNGVEI